MGFPAAIATVLLAAQTPTAMSLARVLDAHRNYLDRIQTLQAEIEMWESLNEGSNWTLVSRDQWWKDGPRERFTTSAGGFHDMGGTFRPVAVRLETSFAPEETRVLNGWDRERTPSLPPSPANQYHLSSATIAGPTSTASVSGRPPFLMMLAPTLNEYLPEAVKHGSAVSLSRVAASRGGHWDVSFETTIGVPARVRVMMHPGRGFALSEREITTRGPASGRGRSEVLEYQEVEPFLFFPVRIRVSTPGQPGPLREVRVKNLRVNEPVPAEALILQFPDGMKVRDIKSDAVHIWGSGGPRLTFESKEDLDRYERSFLTRRSTTPLWSYVVISLAFAVTFVGLLLLRRRWSARRVAA